MRTTRVSDLRPRSLWLGACSSCCSFAVGRRGGECDQVSSVALTISGREHRSGLRGSARCRRIFRTCPSSGQQRRNLRTPWLTFAPSLPRAQSTRTACWHPFFLHLSKKLPGHSMRAQSPKNSQDIVCELSMIVDTQDDCAGMVRVRSFRPRASTQAAARTGQKFQPRGCAS